MSTSTTSNKFALYISIGKIAAMVAQFVMPMFLTRYLSKADYGTYAQFYLVQGFLGSILCFGIQSNPYYFYPGSSELRKKHIIWNTFLLLLLFGVVGSSALFIPFVNEWLLKNETLNNLLPIVLASVIFFIPTNLIDALAVVKNNKSLAVVYHPASIIIKIIAVISFALIFKSIEAIIGSILLLNIIMFLIVLICVIKFYPIKKNEKPISLPLLKEQLKYAIPFGVAVILSTTCNQVDKIMCVNYLTVEEYAIYSVAFFGIPGVMQIYDSLCLVNIMNMSAAYKEGAIETVKSLYKRFVVQTLSFSLPVIGIVCLFSPQIITFLFSEKYIDSVPFFRLYVLTFILGMVGSGTILRAVGKTRLSMRAFALSTIICIPLTFFAIREYGIWGAISCAMINTMLPKIFQIAFECKALKTPVKEYFPFRDIARITFITGGLIIPIIAVNTYFNLNILTCIILSLIYLAAVYGLEIKYNVFLLDKQKVSAKIQKIKQIRIIRYITKEL